MSERPSSEELVQRVDPAHRTYLSYIDRTREYYEAQGYERPYRYAFFDQVPFTPLSRRLAECRLTLVTTALPVGSPVEDASGLRIRGQVWSLASDPPPRSLYTAHVAWDKSATHTEDLDSYFPVHRLEELRAEGRIAGLAPRLHGIPTEYSHRRTRETDAPELLRRVQEDGADAVLLVPL